MSRPDISRRLWTIPALFFACLAVHPAAALVIDSAVITGPGEINYNVSSSAFYDITVKGSGAPANTTFRLDFEVYDNDNEYDRLVTNYGFVHSDAAGNFDSKIVNPGGTFSLSAKYSSDIGKNEVYGAQGRSKETTAEVHANIIDPSTSKTLLTIAESLPVKAVYHATGGFIVASRGEAYILGADGKKRPARMKARFTESDTLVTKKGRIQFLTDDKTLGNLGPNSDLSIGEYLRREKPVIHTKLKEGFLRVWGGYIAKDPPKDYTYNTPTMEIGIRGTQFLFSEGPDPDDPAMLVGMISVAEGLAAVDGINYLGLPPEFFEPSVSPSSDSLLLEAVFATLAPGQSVFDIIGLGCAVDVPAGSYAVVRPGQCPVLGVGLAPGHEVHIGLLDFTIAEPPTALMILSGLLAGLFLRRRPADRRPTW